jgi:two-component sensor histidine kinase
VDASSDAPILSFDWREINGPPVVLPKRRGFGTTLLEKVVAVQCNAKIELRYHPEGLQFAMQLPLRDTRLVPAY